MKALIFDVFGTCVDWRSSIAREVANALPNVDAFEFADAWRGEYQPAMERIREGGRGYVPLDVLHRENLGRVLERFDVTCDDPNTLNSAWEKLDPWPDVVPGLKVLRQHALVAPCSNGSIGLMARLARYGDLPWDCILGADIAKAYKPMLSVYQSSTAALGYAPKDVIMVAAHNNDLFGAREAGLKTAFVARPFEHGKRQKIDLQPESDWDFVADSFTALAQEIFG